MGPEIDEEEHSEDAPTVQMGTDELAALLGEIVHEESIADPPSLERPVAPEPQPETGPAATGEPEADMPVGWWVAAVAVAVAIGVLGAALLAQ